MTGAETANPRPPAVTALLPVKAYHAGYLREAVDSMREQTCPDWRLLVIVEAPDREEVEAVLGGHLADTRIGMIANEGRKLAGAFNTGMRHAETRFVAILLGDDLWAPTAVEVLAKYVESARPGDFFHTSRRIIDEEGRPISSIHRSRPNVSLEDFGGASPVKHLLCWNRERGLAIGGMDESLNSFGGVDDFDFPWSMAEHGATFMAIPDCLYVYRDHRECFRLSTHPPLSDQKRQLARVLRKHGIDEPTIARRVSTAEQGHFRQSLFRSRVDRFMKGMRGHDARDGWRESHK